MNLLSFLIVLAATTFIGYLAQRSRFCSVSGIRDFFLFRDTYLAYALPGILVGSLASYVVLVRLGFQMPGFPLLFGSAGLSSAVAISLTVIGGVGIGLFSVLADGCPLRQHVRGATGRHDALAYLVGFYSGLLYFFTVGVLLISFLYQL